MQLQKCASMILVPSFHHALCVLWYLMVPVPDASPPQNGQANNGTAANSVGLVAVFMSFAFVGLAASAGVTCPHRVAAFDRSAHLSQRGLHPRRAVSGQCLRGGIAPSPRCLPRKGLSRLGSAFPTRRGSFPSRRTAFVRGGAYRPKAEQDRWWQPAVAVGLLLGLPYHSFLWGSLVAQVATSLTFARRSNTAAWHGDFCPHQQARFLPRSSSSRARSRHSASCVRSQCLRCFDHSHESQSAPPSHASYMITACSVVRSPSTLNGFPHIPGRQTLIVFGGIRQPLRRLNVTRTGEQLDGEGSLIKVWSWLRMLGFAPSHPHRRQSFPKASSISCWALLFRPVASWFW